MHLKWSYFHIVSISERISTYRGTHSSKEKGDGEDLWEVHRHIPSDWKAGWNHDMDSTLLLSYFTLLLWNCLGNRSTVKQVQLQVWIFVHHLVLIQITVGKFFLPYWLLHLWTGRVCEQRGRSETWTLSK